MCDLALGALTTCTKIPSACVCAHADITVRVNSPHQSGGHAGVHAWVHVLPTAHTRTHTHTVVTIHAHTRTYVRTFAILLAGSGVLTSASASALKRLCRCECDNNCFGRKRYVVVGRGGQQCPVCSSTRSINRQPIEWTETCV